MTTEQSFPHHNYQYAVDAGEHQFISRTIATGQETVYPLDLVEIGSSLRLCNVKRVVLLHGTFAGNDILGLMRELARVLPGTADSLKSLGKEIVDQIAGEVGNFTSNFADRLHGILNVEGNNTNLNNASIDVQRFAWSGENHHVGRAGGALSLLDQLLSESWAPGDRVLLWAHSHGGNLLALLSQLLSGNLPTIRAFFQATRSHYQDPVLGILDLPIWQRMQDALLDPLVCHRLPALDVVTFGTPPRYRWNRSLCRQPLHFVQHRSLDSDSPCKACMPQSIHQLTTAAGGDYVQQLGIGGTDFLHSILAWRSWNSERRLRQILEPGIRRRDLPRNLAKGHRLALDGKTLLVDYPSTPGRWNQSLLGHGIYTRSEWLPFHLRQIVAHFYPLIPNNI